MKVASYIKKVITVILIQVCFYSQYVDIILLAFSLSRKRRSSHQRCSIKSYSRDLKAKSTGTNFEIVVKDIIFLSSAEVEIRENFLIRQNFTNLLKSVP